MSVLKVHTVYDISTHALTEGDFIHRHQLQCLVISTHALTEGDVDENDTTKKWNISTHALTEGDNARTAERDCRKHFNSRPHGGRLRRNRCIRTGHEISTHALTEGDQPTGFRSEPISYFNSRPHGGRHDLVSTNYAPPVFQLTPSRRATANLDKFFF